MIIDDDVIVEIMQKYEEKDWLTKCREALPNATDGYILSAFEIHSHGDVLRLKFPWTM